jgi:hypothetical protein
MVGTNKTGGGRGTTRDVHGQVHKHGQAVQRPEMAVAAPTPAAGSLLAQARRRMVEPDRFAPIELPGGIRLHSGAMFVPSKSRPGLFHKVRAWTVERLVQTSCSCEAARYGHGSPSCKHALQALEALEQHGLVRHGSDGWTAQPAAFAALGLASPTAPPPPHTPAPPAAPGDPAAARAASAPEPQPGTMDRGKPDVRPSFRYPYNPKAPPSPALWE